MTIVKRFEVTGTKCLDDGSQTQALLIGSANRTIITLAFGKASHNQVHELDRLIVRMGLTAVEVKNYEPTRTVQSVRRRVRPRPGRGSFWAQ